MRKKVALVLALFMLFSVFFGACSSKGGKDTGQEATKQGEGASNEETIAAEEGVLLMGGCPKEKFEAAWANPGGFVRVWLFRRLLMCDENLNVVGTDLAKEWNVSPDGLTYTFVLRDDIKWHDGTKMTAEDVEWSLKMALKSASINATFINAFSKIEGAPEYKEGKTENLAGVTVEGNKITIKLTDKVAAFPLVMAQWPPYPKHLLEKEDPLKLHLATFWEKPIGNGPFMLTEVKPSNYAIMEPFKDYYGPKPKIKKVLLQYFDSPDPTIATKANKIYYTTSMSLEQVKEILKNPNYKAIPVSIFYIRYLQPNLNNNEKIADPRIRKALLYAIDRKKIANELFAEQATVINSKIPPESFWYNKEPEIYDYNPVKAKELLKEAGFNFNNTIRLAYYYTDQQTVDLIEAIRYYWEQIGIKCETTLLQGNLLELIYEQRDYDFLYAGLSAMALEEVYGFLHSNHTMGQKLGMGNKEILDPLIDAMNREGDQAKRKEIVKQIQEVENQYLFQMPLFALKMYIVEHKNLKKPAIYGNEWFNYDYKLHEWEVVK
ncbi:MAG: ABC transporter substrate-binding protein [Firmicutes bacterium]|nr:ABC transporter substrate-binding protein [Bacillota bacterium]